MKILLAENEEFLSGIYASRLRGHGFEVLSAFDGEEAWDHFLNHEFVLVFLSATLPKKNGLMVLKSIRSHHDAGKASVPVILVADDARLEHVEAALKLGAGDYAVKKQHTPDDIVRRAMALIRN